MEHITIRNISRVASSSGAYKTEWYGSKAKVLRRFRDMQVIDYGCRGKGIITDIRLFPGIQFSLQDMDTEVVFPAQTFLEDIVSINYCVDRQNKRVTKHKQGLLFERNGI